MAAGFWAALYLYGKGLPIWACCVVGFLFFVFLVLSGTPEPPPGFVPFFVILSLVFLSVVLYSVFRLDLDQRKILPAQVVKTKGTIVFERPWGRWRSLIVDAEDGKRYLIKISPLRPFREGDIVEISGKSESFKLDFSKGFNESLYWKTKGVDQVLTSPRVTVVGSSGFSLSRWRRLLREKLLLSLPPNTRGYLLAAWLGVRDPVLQDAHARWGTSHILAISGFHVGLLVFLVAFFAKRAVWLQSIVLWLYVLASGAQVSAVRAAVMIQIFLLAKVVGRPSKALNTVCIASVLLLLIRPLWFWDLGFRLSVMAALTLSVVGAGSIAWRKLIVLPAVWFTTGVLISRSFGGVPIAGIIINMLAIPFFSFILPLGSFLAVFPVVFGGAGTWEYFVLPVEFLLSLWHNFADMIASILPVTVGAKFFPFPIVALMIMYFVYKRSWGAGLLSVCLSVCVAVFVALIDSILP